MTEPKTNQTGTVTPAQTRRMQGVFFDLLFGENEGYVFVCHGTPSGDRNTDWHDEAFMWPKEKNKMLKHIEDLTQGHNMYFCSQLFSRPKRIKDNVTVCPNLWADLDTCPPDIVEPKIPIVLESSPGRYQAFWPLKDGPIPGPLAEDYCHRLHHKYADNGADLSGWDLTQVLRVPFTLNYKSKYGDPSVVKVLTSSEVKVPSALFDALPVVPGKSFEKTDLPATVRTYKEVLDEFSAKLSDEYFMLHDTIPETGTDWSKRLWRLMLVAFEAGMKPEDVYVAARTSQVDKFARNQLPPTHLWYDVKRAESTAKIPQMYADRRKFDFPQLVDEDEVEPLGFVFDYIEWASEQSDAARAYHEVSAFIMLSAVLAGSLRMPLANIGELVPNLWALIVADTTLTRKTTAMKTAMDIIQEVDPDVMLATDGSIEGMMQALSTRPSRPSIFLRDEFSGFMESVTKKDYMAGTLESLTKLYDGDHLRRVLAKSVIDVRDPVVLVFGGGIKNKLQGLLNEKHVTSGFIPRFLIVSAESNITKMKPLSRRGVVDQSKRDEFIKYLGELRNTYHSERPVTIAGVTKLQMQHIYADITDEALDFYNQCERQLVTLGYNAADRDIYMPVMDRMSKNMLKMSMLIAATRQEPNEEFQILVELDDVKVAALYIQRWAPHMIELLQNLGNNSSEQVLQKVLNAIIKFPGINRGTVMRNGRIQAWEMENIERTLTQRGQISVRKQGKGILYYPIADQ
jgi:hypothetical protein